MKSNQSSDKQKKAVDSHAVYRGLFKKLSQSTHYASEIKKRADICKNVLKKYQHIKKVKFYLYNHQSKSNSIRGLTYDRIRKSGGEVVPSFHKTVNFLVVPDSVFR